MSNKRLLNNSIIFQNACHLLKIINFYALDSTISVKLVTAQKISLNINNKKLLLRTLLFTLVCIVL